MRDCEVLATGFAHSPVEQALTFAASKRHFDAAAANPLIAAIVTTSELASEWPLDRGLVLARAVEQAFYTAHNRLALQLSPLASAVIHCTASISQRAIVGESVTVGARAEISDGAIVLDGVEIGEDVFIGPGAIVGAEGHFGKNFDDKLMRVLHTGGVRIGPRCHLHAGAIVQKSVERLRTVISADTVIGPGAQIGHGVTIGKRSVIAGGATLAGYTAVGDDVWIGPGAVVRNLTTVGDGARIEIGAVVASSVVEKARMSSPFAMTHTKIMRLMAKWMRE